MSDKQYSQGQTSILDEVGEPVDWDSLSPEEREEIEQGIHEIEAGHGISNSRVHAETMRWINERKCNRTK